MNVFVGMTNSICSFIIDSGADISIMKVDKLLPHQVVDRSKNYRITGITDGVKETLAEAITPLKFNNGLIVNHNFQLVESNFPIPTDGILGRDFLTTFKCTIDYEHWLLNFKFQQSEISIPIEDNYNRKILIPARCEVVRKIPNFNVSEDTLIHSQEILPGVFCGNTIVLRTRC